MASLGNQFTPRAKSTKKPRSPDSNQDNRKSSQVAHTLTACCRCRHRKTRCDAGLPRCGPCERNNAACDYFDAAKGKKMSRGYVVLLQNKVRQLENEMANFTEQEDNVPLDIEGLVRGAGLVKIKENDEDRYLGPSSGIAMTRLVMELAKELCQTTQIKAIVPERKAKEIKETFAKEASKPTSKIYPLISFVAAPNLPSWDLTENLLENFNIKAQYLYPVLHEPSFNDLVRDVYDGSTDSYKNFTLRIVIAISMQKLDTQYAGLADSYYLAALTYLENAIRPMNLGTLQCFALIAIYSMTTPTRTAAYWVVGLATKLCQELRMTDESTLPYDSFGNRLNAIEIDLRRRMFWIITSMELGLAHSLGRPSAFGITHDHIDIKPFLPIDDKDLLPEGARPRSQPSMKKKIAMHFMKMRLLQLEVRRTLYMRKRPAPVDDEDPWFAEMEAKMNDWMASSPKNDEGSGLSEIWFKARYNTMVVFLFRPSPQVPEPSLKAAQLCFEASRFNVYVQRQQIATKSVDLTWIFTQSLFMAINTLLWALSYSGIRKEHPKMDVERHLTTALEAIYWASQKWPGVDAARELYTTLVEACLKAYDGDEEISYSVGSPKANAAASPQSIDTPPPLSTPSTIHSTLASAQTDAQSPPFIYNVEHSEAMPATTAPPTTQSIDFANGVSHPLQATSLDHGAEYANSSGSQEILFDPNSYNNPLPSPLDYGYSPEVSDAFYPSFSHDRNHYFDSIGEQYTQYLQAQYMPQGPMDGLNLEQQSELMNTLELNGLYGLSAEK